MAPTRLGRSAVPLSIACLLCAGAAAQAPAVDETPAGAGEWGFRPSAAHPATTDPPAFVWRPQRAARSYALQVAPADGDFAEPSYRVAGLRHAVHCPPHGFGAGDWQWRFRYLNSDDTPSSWSSARRFRITADLPEFALPSHEDALDRVPRAHPRLFVRPEQRAQLQELARGALREEFAALRARCERIVEEPPDTTEPPRYPPDTERGSEAWREIWWGNRRRTIAVLDNAAQLAFAHWLEPEPRFRDTAKRLLLAAADWDPHGATGYRYNDEAGMPYAYHFARTYTFLHHELDDAERTRCLDLLATRGREMYEHLCPRHLWRPYSSHSNRAWHFLGEVAIACRGDVPAADDWLRFALDVFGAVYPVWSDADGGWHEGLSYWRSYLTRFTWWADVMREAFDIDAYRKPFFARAGDFGLYTMPPGTRGGGFGDLNGTRRSGQIQELMALFARQAGNPYWQWHADQHGELPKVRDFIGFLRQTLPEVTPRAPRDLPTARLFGGTGVAALHTSLLDASDDVALRFKSSPFGTRSHGYEANNALLLQAFGERLLIRSGRRDVYGSAHHRNWMWSTRSVNSVTVSGHGQGKRTAAARGAIVDFAHTEHFDWVEGEAGAAYGERVSSFRRGILFVKPDRILVFDRLRFPEAEQATQWWHAEQPFDLDGPRAELEVGEAALRMDWLWPQELEFEQTDRFDPPPRPRIKLVEHHLTATALAATQRQHFVTSLTPRRAGAEPAPTPEITALQDGYRVELPGRDGGVTTVFLRDDDAATVGAVARDASGEVVARFRHEPPVDD